MRCTALVGAMMLGASSLGATQAQKQAQNPNALAFGVEAGVFDFGDDYALLQLGFRAAPARGGFGSVDFALASFPDGWSHGVLLFLMDLGITYGAPSENSTVFIFPHAGLTALVGGDISGGGGGGGGIGGLNAGLGLLVHPSGPLGVRVDYTYRRFKGADIGTPSITFGLTFIH